MKKEVHKSKTMWFSFALMVLGALFDNFSVLQGLIDPRFYAFSLIIIGMVVAALRAVTTKPLE